jgi:hypothetical protein
VFSSSTHLSIMSFKVNQFHVNAEKHSGAIDVHTSSDLTEGADASDLKATGFKLAKTHEMGEGLHAYSKPVGQYVLVPRLFPQVASHVIFASNKTQIINKTPAGNVHIIFDLDKEKRQFSIINQHTGDLHVKHDPPKTGVNLSPASKDYLGTFDDSVTMHTKDSHDYAAEGHYSIRSTLDPNPANMFTIDFINNKVHMANVNPAGEISMALDLY